MLHMCCLVVYVIFDVTVLNFVCLMSTNIKQPPPPEGRPKGKGATTAVQLTKTQAVEEAGGPTRRLSV
jgi:hypothetical protein